MASYQIWVCSPDGVRLFGYVPRYGMSYSMATNAVGRFEATLPGSVETTAWQIANTPDLIPTGQPQQHLRADMVVEVRRAPTPPTGQTGIGYQLERLYFIREIKRYIDSAGRRLVKISGPDLVEVLKRRIIAYNAGTSQADKTGPADNVMKAYVRENLGPSATNSARNLDSAYWSVDGDSSQGAAIDVSASTRVLYDVCRDCAEASKTGGTDIYFDVVPVNGMSLAFRTFKGQRGTDRSTTGTGSSFVLLSFMTGSLSQPATTEDWDEEANVIYTTGIGPSIDDVTKSAEDTPRRTRSIWARREWWENTRDQATTQLVPMRAASALAAHRPRLRFEADAIDSDALQYGRDYRWGDKLTAVYDNTYTVTAQAVDVRVSESRINKTTGAVEPPQDAVHIHYEVAS